MSKGSKDMHVPDVMCMHSCRFGMPPSGLIIAHHTAAQPYALSYLMRSKVGTDTCNLPPEQGECNSCSALVAAHAQHSTSHAGRAHLSYRSLQCMPASAAAQLGGACESELPVVM